MTQTCPNTSPEAQLRARLHAPVDSLSDVKLLERLQGTADAHLHEQQQRYGDVSEARMARHEQAIAAFRQNNVSYSPEETKALLKAARP